MRDLYNNIEIDDTIDPVSFADSGAPGDATVDLIECDSAALVFYIGTPATALSTSNYMTFTLTHSDDDSTYANVTTADMLGVTVTSGLILTVDGETGQVANRSYRFGYVGGKRYLKIASAEVGTLPATPVAVLTIKGNLMDSPPI
jgi:hypothetical protein